VAENTEISWTDHTFNCWWGCTRVSPACEHCYAETLAKRFGTGWGVQARRRFFGEKHWQEPLRWNERAEREGQRARVFCASMADVFELLPDSHPDAEAMETARVRLFDLIGATPKLDWLLLTKRPEHVAELVLTDWNIDGFPANVWLGTTVEDQRRAEERIPHLLRVPARVRFLSCEPLLGPLELWQYFGSRHSDAHIAEPFSEAAKASCPRCSLGAWPIHWVIAGGESGHGARPMHPQWAFSLRDQCQAAGVPFHFKQWGRWAPSSLESADAGVWPDGTWKSGDEWRDGATPMKRHATKHDAGRHLGIRTWDGFPTAALAEEHGKRLVGWVTEP
jgi:protein gp37